MGTKVPCCPAPTNLQHFCGSIQSPVDGVKQAVEADLEQLGTWADLILLHWPCATMEDTIAAYKQLEPLVENGKARSIGISNFNASLIDALLKEVTVPPAVNQCGFSIGNHNSSLFGRDLATLQRCKEVGITYSAYSPLGGLSGIDVLTDPDVVAIAKAHDKSPAQVALRW